jgi:hypothetical protein
MHQVAWLPSLDDFRCDACARMKKVCKRCVSSHQLHQIVMEAAKLPTLQLTLGWAMDWVWVMGWGWAMDLEMDLAMDWAVGWAQGWALARRVASGRSGRRLPRTWPTVQHPGCSW